MSNTCFFLHFFDTGNSTIETLLGKMDAMENVTTLLDFDRQWQRVGQHYNIDQRILDNLKPGDFQSPTKTMLEYIVKREPTATVDTFLRSLLNINRSDVIEDLKEIFYGKIIFPSLLKRTHTHTYLPEIYYKCQILPIIKKSTSKSMWGVSFLRCCGAATVGSKERF